LQYRQEYDSQTLQILNFWINHIYSYLLVVLWESHARECSVAHTENEENPRTLSHKTSCPQRDDEPRDLQRNRVIGAAGSLKCGI